LFGEIKHKEHDLPIYPSGLPLKTFLADVPYDVTLAPGTPQPRDLQRPKKQKLRDALHLTYDIEEEIDSTCDLFSQYPTWPFPIELAVQFPAELIPMEKIDKILKRKTNLIPSIKIKKTIQMIKPKPINENLSFLKNEWVKIEMISSNYELFPKFHTLTVQQMLRNGILLFIVSEAMLFFSFFFAYGDVAFAPSHQIYTEWPPQNFQILSPWGIPLLNTCILLWSGIIVTTAHKILLMNPRAWRRNRRIKEITYLRTILRSVGFRLRNAFFLGLLFLSLQVFEYLNAPFSINDGVYGSIFYILTGFHGMHVLIGAIFLSIISLRCFQYHYDEYNQFVGLEGALWYWHFVDVVWILLYIVLYIWPAV
jgi:cytochrome c oxidase subunit 3